MTERIYNLNHLQNLISKSFTNDLIGSNIIDESDHMDISEVKNIMLKHKFEFL